MEKGRERSNFVGQSDSEDENDEAFGSSIGFPTGRRPCDARRTIDETTLDADITAWFASSKLRVGSHLSELESPIHVERHILGQRSAARCHRPGLPRIPNQVRI